MVHSVASAFLGLSDSQQEANFRWVVEVNAVTGWIFSFQSPYNAQNPDPTFKLGWAERAAVEPT